MTVPLAARLRAATKALHTEVERTGVMPRLLRGQLSRTAYTALLRNLHALYEALEPALAQHAAHPRLLPLHPALHQPPLARRDALARDLQALHGTGWAEALPLQPAARDYAAHLGHLAERQPALLAAHAYVRYLGDLSGGQQLAAIVARSLQLAPGHGVAFYDFGPPAQVAGLARALRAGLDGVARDEAEAAALVDEACAAFERHRLLFEQLDQRRDERVDEALAPR